jgi:aspartate 1-decarboxylase
MKYNLCRAKLHRVSVTGGNLNYEGSITIGRDLMKAAGLQPFELVHVNSLENAAHWETYVIPGVEGFEDGEIILNGAPSRIFQRGDVVVIMAFAQLSEGELADFLQRVVYVDSAWKPNVVTRIEDKSLRDYL